MTDFLGNFREEDEQAQQLLATFNQDSANDPVKVDVQVSYYLKNATPIVLREEVLLGVVGRGALPTMALLARHLKKAYEVITISVHTNNEDDTRTVVVNSDDVLYVNILAKPHEQESDDEIRRRNLRRS